MARAKGGIMSLPGIDTSGKSVYESEGPVEAVFQSRSGMRGHGLGLQQELVTERFALDVSAARFLDASALHPGKPAEEGGQPLFLQHLDPKLVASKIGECSTALQEVSAAFSTPAPVPPAEGEGAGARKACSARAFLEAERRVAALEKTVGTVPTRLDRVPQGSVSELLAQMEGRYKGFALQDEALSRQTNDLIKSLGVGLASFDKLKEDFRATSAFSTAAKAAILFNVLLSVETVASELPSILERLKDLKQLVTDDALAQDAAKPVQAEEEFHKQLTEGHASLQALANESSCLLKVNLAATAASMNELSERIASLEL